MVNSPPGIHAIFGVVLPGPEACSAESDEEGETVSLFLARSCATREGGLHDPHWFFPGSPATETTQGERMTRAKIDKAMPCRLMMTLATLLNRRDQGEDATLTGEPRLPR